jgi:hypothetical protein
LSWFPLLRSIFLPQVLSPPSILIVH